MLKAIAAGLALTMLVAVPACGGDDDKNGSPTINCDNPESKCPNDMVNDDLKNLCKTLLNLQACRDIVITYFTCLQDHQVCTADGVTDQEKTNNACLSQYNAASACAGADGGT
jgi:hypothetical protein